MARENSKSSMVISRSQRSKLVPLLGRLVVISEHTVFVRVRESCWARPRMADMECVGCLVLRWWKEVQFFYNGAWFCFTFSQCVGVHGDQLPLFAALLCRPFKNFLVGYLAFRSSHLVSCKGPARKFESSPG